MNIATRWLFSQTSKNFKKSKIELLRKHFSTREGEASGKLWHRCCVAHSASVLISPHHSTPPWSRGYQAPAAIGRNSGPGEEISVPISTRLIKIFSAASVDDRWKQNNLARDQIPRMGPLSFTIAPRARSKPGYLNQNDAREWNVIGCLFYVCKWGHYPGQIRTQITRKHSRTFYSIVP